MVFRVYVEKKDGFDVEAKHLKADIKSFLQINSLENLRLINRYDVENIDKELFENCKTTVFSEPQVDKITEEIENDGAYMIVVEYLPGQYDQRADSAAQCIQIISCKEKPTVKTAKVYLLYGNLSADDITAIKKYLINPVESRETTNDKFETLADSFEIPESVATVEGFIKASDDELLKIFERTYGKIQETNPNRTMRTQNDNTTPVKGKNVSYGAKKAPQKEYLLVDGYNIIFAWEELKKISLDSLEAARNKLVEKMVTYKMFKDHEIIIVFDAYKVRGNRGEVENLDGITVVYTKEAQTADAYIEKVAKELSKNYKVTVATSDGLEQLIIFGSGAYRMPARVLQQSVESVEEGIRNILDSYNLSAENVDFLRVLKDKLK